MPFLRTATVRQDSRDTFEVVTASEVKVSFFGSLEFGRVGQPRQTPDGVARVASLEDLLATKLKVILQRSEAKDYKDIAAMVKAGVRLDTGLAAAEQMFRPTFPPAESLKALVYFQGEDMQRVTADERQVLVAAARGVKSLPIVKLLPDLALRQTTSSPARAVPEPSTVDPPRLGPKMGM